ncbi:MAG: DASS family sodium-coupled anion symporter [Peptococcaceae bacterium]|jgi:sodium-dependent dicarboxylate transporter 2/3/5|nr:DASS family sodium-coupled anion symporter [Peptococcaceae bacterium]
MDPKNLKKLIWLVVAIVVYFIIANVPISQDLEPQGQKALALMVVAVIAWVAEILPIAISSLALVFMQVVIGTANAGGAVGNFATPTFLFVLSSFFLANALLGSGLSKRLSLQLSVMSKGSPQRVLFYIMLVASIASMVISDVPVAAAFFPIGLSLIEKNNLALGKSNFAKSLLIGIPFAALIGGVGTPAGSSLNVQALGLLESTTGMSISFAKWAALGIPAALILTVLAWLILVFVYKPEIAKLQGLEDINKELKELGPMSVNEKKWIGVMVLLIIVWLTESVHHLPIPATTTLGAALFFLPGFGFLDWKTQKVGWEVLLLIGSATSLGTTFYQSGAAEWLANLTLGGIQGASPVMALAVVIIFTIVIHLLVPVNPAIVSIMVPTLAAFATTAGINPLMLIVPMAFTVSAAFLLPLDPVPLITYGAGHYTMGDFFKAGWLMSIAWAVVMLILMLILGGPLGMF